MIEKSIMVIIFMYLLTVSLLVFQYSLGDPYGLFLTNYKGEPIKDALLETSQIQNINEKNRNILDTNFEGTVNNQTFNRVVDFNVGMAYTVWEYTSIITGTYIFFILHFLGVPLIMVSGIIIIYGLFVVRTIAGMLRGF